MGGAADGIGAHRKKHGEITVAHGSKETKSDVV